LEGERFDLEDVSGSSDEENQAPQPLLCQLGIVPVSPVKKRQYRAALQIIWMDDVEVWDMSDDEILGAYL
jgi:hypothetical protein